MRTAPAPAAARASWVVSIDRADGRVEFDAGSESSASLPGLRAAFSGVLFEPDDLAARLGVAGQAPSPAALVLLAYRQLGDAWLDALAGHFAIVIDDRSRERLVAVRDRMGQHPLFYAEAGATMFFSWSIARLLEQPGVSADFNRVQLAEHLLGRWPVAEETYYAGVRRVQPAHLLEVSRRGIRDHWYWNPSEKEPLAIGDAEGQDRFDAAFSRAVQRCLDQGATAINLSGGLDSISVAAVAADLARRQGRPAPLALSLGFPDPACNEEFVQRSAAQALGLDQHFVKFDDAVRPDGLLMNATRLSPRFDAPLANLWWPAYEHLARAGRERGRTVVMTGTGGDEWLTVSPYLAADLLRVGRFGDLARFIGVNMRSYKLTALQTLYSNLWRFGVRPILTMTADRFAPHWLSARHRRKMAASVLPWVAPDSQLRAQMDDRAELTIAPATPYRQSFYQREMRMALMHALASLEYEELFESGRDIGVTFMHPYIDADLVDLLYRLPPAVLARGQRSKGLVRDAVARRFPGLGFERQRKINATDFYHTTLRREGRAAWDSVKHGAQLEALGVIDAAAVTALVDKRVTGPRTRESYRIWTVLNLASWASRSGSVNRRGA